MFRDVSECSGMFRDVPCSGFYRCPFVVGAISPEEDWIVGEIYSAVVFLFFPSFKLYIIFASFFQTIFIGTFSIYIIIVIPIKNSSVNRKKTGRNIVVVVVFLNQYK